MNVRNEPLVSVITPVYNGEEYLSECIESVLAQTYSNWDYTVVDNCSTDGTLRLARQYAQKDNRIRVCENEMTLDIIANHNKAFRLISPGSKYCKVLCADDWLFPECLSKLVSVAEAHPSVGVVSSYQLSGRGKDARAWSVKWTELPYPSTVIPGREICRSFLLGGPYVLGTPTSSLYRSDLVRAQDSFYPNPSPHADTSACIRCLKNTDFGFVHQVLSYERVHEAAMSAECRNLNTYVSSQLNDLIVYGPHYLTASEMSVRIKESLAWYYKYLAAAAIHTRDPEFWAYHKRRLHECGYPLSKLRLAKSVAAKVLDLVLNPKQSAEKLLRRPHHRQP